ncbi:MAG: BBE domain-containing protein [Candidatus Hydrogenedentota bacterium]
MNGVYLNFLAADDGARAQAAYNLDYRRLAKIKRAYDSANLFRGKPNIKPAAGYRTRMTRRVPGCCGQASLGVIIAQTPGTHT